MPNSLILCDPMECSPPGSSVYVKTYQNFHFKYVQFIICQVGLIEAAFFFFLILYFTLLTASMIRPISGEKP